MSSDEKAPRGIITTLFGGAITPFAYLRLIVLCGVAYSCGSYALGFGFDAGRLLSAIYWTGIAMSAVHFGVVKP